MVTLSRNPWSPRLAAGLLWAGAAALAVFWGLKLSAPRQVSAVPQASSTAPVQVDSAAMGRTLGVPDGAPAAAPAAATRWRLMGVMAGKNSGGGAAVIAIDDAPVKVYRVGSTVADGLVLQTLRSDAPRVVTLGASVDGPASVTLELPPVKSIGAPNTMSAPSAFAAPAAPNVPNAAAAAPAASPVAASPVVAPPGQMQMPVPGQMGNVDHSTGVDR